MAFPGNVRADRYIPGDWNITCSMCGFKFKASDVVKNWQGQYRCRKCNEERHPQEFVRAVPDRPQVPFSQPPKEVFIQVCSLSGRLGLPGFAIPACCICGLVFDYSGFPIPPPIPPGPTPPAAEDGYFDSQFFSNKYFKRYF